MQAHPNTLIDDFIIAGLSQESLKEQVMNGEWNNLLGITPQVLFSMYNQTSNIERYMQFVFPEGVSLWFDANPPKPTFYTFMTTNHLGTNAYFHVLRYYEKVSLEHLRQEKKPMIVGKRRVNFPNNAKANRLSSSLEVSQGVNIKDMDDQDVEGLAFDNNDIRGRIAGEARAAKDLVHNFDNEALFKEFQKKNRKIEPAKQRESKEVDVTQSQPFFINKLMQNQSEVIVDRASLKHEHFEPQEMEENKMESNLSKVEEGSSESHDNSLNIPNIDAVNTDSNADSGSLRETSSSGASDNGENCSYVPMCFMIQTEVEYHDIFKEILVQLLESIRKPKKVSPHDNAVDNKTLAYADFIAHIAFLKTIPVPTFNTTYNIEWFGKTLVLNESFFHDVPNKNKQPIQVLFEVLDVQTILNCWKAILFEYSLVVISSQQSVQFLVLDALKQLLFPLTWQNNYIQPCGKALIEFAIDCIFPVIFSVDAMHFKYENLRAEMADKEKVCILDIDGNFMNTEDLNLPKLANETDALRVLNQIKNQKISKYDMAYKEFQDVEREDNVLEIRRVFLGILGPYIRRIEKFFKQDVIDKAKKAGDREGKVTFGQYFDKEKYMDQFYDEPDEEFAQELLLSAQFVHFCDDRLEERGDLTNYRMFEAYLNQGVDVDQSEVKNLPGTSNQQAEELFSEMREAEIGGTESVRKSRYSKRPANEVIEEEEKKLEEEQKAEVKPWNVNKPVIIDWKMPIDNWRVMLFDKIEYMIELSAKDDDEKQAQVSTPGASFLSTESNHKKNAINKIKTIRKLYPEMLPLYKEQLIRIGAYIPTDVKKRKDKKNSSQSSRPRKDGSKPKDHICNAFSKTKRLSYGDEGFLRFLEILLGLLNDQDTHQVNYYFGLKVLLERMENYIPNQQNSIDNEKHMNNFWSFNQLPSQKRQSNASSLQQETFMFQAGTVYRKPNAKSIEGKPNTHHREKQNKSKSKEKCSELVHDEIITQFEAQNLAPSVWMFPQEWRESSASLRRSCQFIQMKVNASSAFENFEDKMAIVLQELLYWPRSQAEFFPRVRFEFVLKNLTREQKISYSEKIDQVIVRNQAKFCAPQLIQFNRIAEEKCQERGVHSLDDTIFQQVCVCSVIADRERMKMLEERKNQNLTPSRPSVAQSQSSSYGRGARPSDAKLPQSSRQSLQSQRDSMLKKVDDQRESKVGLVGRMHAASIKQKPGSSRGVTQSIPEEISKFQKLQESANTSRPQQSVPLSSQGCSNEGSMSQRGPSSSQTTQYTGGRTQSNTSMSLGAQFTARQSSAIPQDELEIEPQGPKKAEELLHKIIKFFSDNDKHLHIKRVGNRGATGKFAESEVFRLQEELAKIKQKANKFKKKELLFGAFQDLTNIVMQCFWLNILNYMVLMKLAELLTCEDGAVKKLQSYSMWQALLEGSTIYISHVKLTAFQVFHSILRQKADMPMFGQFMLQKHSEESIAPKIRHLIVEDPHPLIMFGLYLPIGNMPQLQIFTKCDFEFQLKRAVQINSQGSIIARGGNFLVRLPRYVEWFKGQATKDLSAMLQFFLDQEIVEKDSAEYVHLEKVLQQIDNGRKDYHGRIQHVFEFEEFNWQICLIHLTTNTKSNGKLSNMYLQRKEDGDI